MFRGHRGRLAFLSVFGALLVLASPAAAQGRAWCLTENTSRGAVMCSFYTFEQCQEDQ